MALIIDSLGPALAAGNTVGAKLPGQTALTNALVGDVVSKVPSLPAGVVNVFTESGEAGAPFSSNRLMLTDGSLASGAFYRPSGSKSRTSAHRSSSKKSSGRSRHSRSSTTK